MKLIKSPKNLQLIERETVLQEFPLITSIVYFAAAWFRKEIKWKVKEDVSFLKPMVVGMIAKNALSKEDLEVLNLYESHYQEIKDSSADARRDLMSTGNRTTNNMFSIYADSNLDEIVHKEKSNGNK